MSESKQWEITPDNPTVQQCCLSYGGHSFPGPMRNALKCHLSILRREHPEWEAAPSLLDACKKYQQAIQLLYELNPNVEICIGAGLALKQAEDAGQAAIKLAQKEG